MTAWLLDALIAATLILTAVAVLVSRSLFRSVVMFIAFGMLMALAGSAVLFWQLPWQAGHLVDAPFWTPKAYQIPALLFPIGLALVIGLAADCHLKNRTFRFTSSLPGLSATLEALLQKHGLMAVVMLILLLALANHLP